MRRSKAEVERYIASVQGSAPSPREVSRSGPAGRPAGVMAPGGLGSGWSGGGRGRRGVALLSTGGAGTAAARVSSSWRAAGSLGPRCLGLGGAGRLGALFGARLAAAGAFGPRDRQIRRRRPCLPGRLTPPGGGLLPLCGWLRGHGADEQPHSQGASHGRPLIGVFRCCAPLLTSPFPKSPLEAILAF